MRHRIALLVTLPLLAAGSLTAHQAGYCATLRERCGEGLHETGHAYLGHPQPLVAALAALLLVGLLVEGVTAGNNARRQLAAWPSALVAPLGFVLQEHLERIAHEGGVSSVLLVEPAFLVGLALQLPFALVAWWVARALLRAAPTVVAALRDSGRRPRLACHRWTPRRPPVRSAAPTVTLATCAAGRAPPRRHLAHVGSPAR